MHLLRSKYAEIVFVKGKAVMGWKEKGVKGAEKLRSHFFVNT